MLPLTAGDQSAGWQSVIWREPQVCYLLADMIRNGNAAAPHTRQAAEVLLYLLEQKREGPQ